MSKDAEVQSIAPDQDVERVPGVFEDLKEAVKYLRALKTKNNGVFRFSVQGLEGEDDEVRYIVCQSRDRAGYLILMDMFSDTDNMSLGPIGRDELYNLIV